MRLVLAIALLTILAPAAAAQDEGAGPGKAPCGLSMAEVPGVGALRLGMTPQQVLALFPGSAEDPEIRARLSRQASPFGVMVFSVSPDKYQSKENVAGISRISLNFLDGRVYTFNITYKGPEWPHVDKFVAKVVEGTALPPAEAWEAYAGMDNQLKVLKCADFEIRVFAGGQGGELNYVLMTDLVAARTLKDRRRKAMEKEGQGSKP